jgi:hypothetical protein
MGDALIETTRIDLQRYFSFLKQSRNSVQYYRNKYLGFTNGIHHIASLTHSAYFILNSNKDYMSQQDYIRCSAIVPDFKTKLIIGLNISIKTAENFNGKV